MRRFLTVLVLLLSSAPLMATPQEPADKRTSADAEMQKNNFADALKTYQELLQGPQGSKHDLQQAVQCLRSLGRIKEVDRLIEDVVAGDRGRAFGGWHVAGDDPHGRRLARAIRTEEAERLARLCPKAHVVDGRKRSVLFGKMLNLNHKRSPD